MLGATCTKRGDRHPNTIELASWLVHVLCDFRATSHEKLQCPLDTTWKYILLIYFTLLVRALPPSFHYSLVIFVFCYTFYYVKIGGKKQFQYLSYQKKCIILSSRIISVTMKSRVTAENIGIKVSALPSSCSLFTAIVLPIL